MQRVFIRDRRDWACRLFLGVALALGGSGPVLAAPEEVQVYLNDINPVGAFGLDLHVNEVPAGDPAPDHVGGESSVGRYRFTPEWSYSITSDIELGAYMPLTTLDSQGTFRVDGYKFRIKWLPQHPQTGFYYGVNDELGYEDKHLNQNPWNNEVKLIGGWQDARWLVGGNVNFDWALKGPAITAPDVELDLKLGWKFSKESMVGIETYNGAGSTKAFGRFSSSDQATYLAYDTALGRWDLNFGVGKGYGANADHLILKMIIGFPIGR